MINRKTAPFFMVLLAASWGSSYVFTKIVTDNAHPLLAFVLQNMSTLAVFLLCYARKLRGFDRSMLRPMIVSGLFAFGSNITTVVGLSMTASTSAAFILQLSLVFVPLFLSIRSHKMPGANIVISALVGLCGLALLTLDFGALTIKPGDLVVVISAICFSGHLIVLEDCGDRLRTQDVLFVYCMICLASAPLALAVLPKDALSFAAFRVPGFAGCLLAAGLIATAAMTMQVGVSAHLSSEVISVSYCLEPVVTAVLAYFVLSERLGGMAWCGVGLIMLALALLVALPLIGRKGAKPVEPLDVTCMEEVV